MSVRISNYPGVLLAGASYDGLGIAACLRSGEARHDCVFDHFAIYRILYSIEHVYSTPSRADILCHQAAGRGLPSVVRSANAGTDFVIERYGS